MIAPGLQLYLIQAAALLAGLALFLYGMSNMSQGLQEAAGKRLRHLLQRATTHPLEALSLGTALGSLIQSSAATVMLIGFVGAGLVTFSSSIPVILGINVGTSLSMLLISFQLGDACWLAILAGATLRCHPRTRPAGTALLGFGLIFLGLRFMSTAIYPFRDNLAPMLRFADGNTPGGMLTGVLAAALLTAIIQSSGATIGMVFAMLTAGAMTSLAQAYPIVIGAGIGTCVTALIGAARSTTEARRCALTHLFFNIFATVLAMLVAPVMYRLIPLTTPGFTAEGPDPRHLVAQCAYANVIRMLLGSTLVLPFSPLVARAVKALLPDRQQDERAFLLDPDLATTPEDALQAAILELQRLTELCATRLQAMPRLLLERDAGTRLTLQETETAVSTIRESMQCFLYQLAAVKLTRRQRLLATLLYNGIDHIDRIADHIGVLARILYARHRTHRAQMPLPTLRRLLVLQRQACAVVQGLGAVLVPRHPHREQPIEHILEARDAFMQTMDTEREQLARDLAEGQCSPAGAIFRSRHFTELSRIVKHARSLALKTRDPRFRIKPQRLQHP